MQKINIEVLGSGCSACKAMCEQVKVIAKDFDQIDSVEYSDDIVRVVELGIMSVPALVINEEVVASGRLLSEDEIIAEIKKAIK